MPRFARINGRTIHYAYRAGRAGRPVVFANSLGTDFRIWDDVRDLLPADTPTLVYDKSGHGLSEGGAATIADHAGDLAGLTDLLGISNALVCGVSVGGMIAQKLSTDRPDLTAGLVLCNTGYKIGTPDVWAERIEAVQNHGLDHIADGVMERWFSAGFRKREADQVAGYRTMLKRTPAKGYAAVCAAIHHADLYAEAGLISCPTICIAGSEDLATPPDVVAALADSISGAALHLFKDVGHIPSIEAPEEIANLIRQQIATLS